VAPSNCRLVSQHKCLLSGLYLVVTSLQTEDVRLRSCSSTVTTHELSLLVFEVLFLAVMDVAVENYVFDAVMLYLVMQVCSIHERGCVSADANENNMFNMQSSSIRSAGLLAAPLRNDVSFRRQLKTELYIRAYCSH